MANEVVKVPDLGGAESVEVIEISVSVGDQVSKEDSIVVLESDKATMDVPSPLDGKVLKILIKEGDKLKEGQPILELETVAVETAESHPQQEEDSTTAADTTNSETAAPQNDPEATGDTGKDESSIQDIVVPELGTDQAVDVIEVLVEEGEQVEEGTNILVLETDKATVEMPITLAGVIESLTIKEGGKVKEGDVVGTIKTVARQGQKTVQATEETTKAAAVAQKSPEKTSAISVPENQQNTKTADFDSSGEAVYAGPAVRQFARKLGVDLARVKGTGSRNRIVKEDVEAFVKHALGSESSNAGGSAIPAIPDIDFSLFGHTVVVPMTKIQKITAANMTRSWLNVPHVTQFDDADITDMEVFRQSLKKEGEKRGVKLTPLAFLLLAGARSLQQHPAFNRSISADGESFIQKDYIHIGIAVDTPKGLMVPVLRDVDQKGLWELASETNELAAKAREGKLKPAEMQGGCFTISSLGAIGGTGFTPIVNAPEVAILGVSKATIKPVWDGKAFQPRNMLPLGLSYDHRVVNGADAGAFMTTLVALLADTRRLAL